MFAQEQDQMLKLTLKALIKLIKPFLRLHSGVHVYVCVRESKALDATGEQTFKAGG